MRLTSLEFYVLKGLKPTTGQNGLDPEELVLKDRLLCNVSTLFTDRFQTNSDVRKLSSKLLALGMIY